MGRYIEHVAAIRLAAVRFLTNHNEELSTRVVLRVTGLYPQISERIDPRASRKVMRRLLRLTATAVGTQDRRALERDLRDLADLRMAGGVDPAVYLAASHAVLPELRRVIFRRAPSAELADRIYAEVEQMVSVAMGSFCQAVISAHQRHQAAMVDFGEPEFPALMV